MDIDSPQVSESMDTTEHRPSSLRSRPVRDRRKSALAQSPGFLADAYFDKLEKRTEIIEKRRAAFYDTQSYSGEVMPVPPKDKMSNQEGDAFPSVKHKPEAQKLFIFYRNAMMQYWEENKPNYIFFEYFESYVNKKFNVEVSAHQIPFLKRLWKFLHVNNRINANLRKNEDFENHSADESDDELGFSGNSNSQSDSSSSTSSKPKSSSHSRHSGSKSSSSQNQTPQTPQTSQTSHTPQTPQTPQTAPTSQTPQSSVKAQPDEPSVIAPEVAEPPAEIEDTEKKSSQLPSPRSQQASKQLTNSSNTNNSPTPSAPPTKIIISHPKQPTNTPQGVQALPDELSPPNKPQSKSTSSSTPTSSTSSSSRRRPQPSSINSAPSGTGGGGRSRPVPPKNPSVCIIGAGIAGLSAAQWLRQHGLTNVTILESRLRIGGRVHTLYLNNSPIELGTQFLFGGTQNPLSVIGSHLGFHYRSFSPDQLTSIPECDIHLNKPTSINDINTPKRPLVKENGTVHKNEDPMDVTIDSSASTISFEESVKSVSQSWFSRLHFGIEPQHLSKSEIENYHTYSDDISLSEQGLSELVQNLASGLNINLGCVVTEINYESQYRSNNVLVKYQDLTEETKKAVYDVVLVTVPLGVLKSNLISFVPPIPTPNQTAIQQLGIGAQNKIGLVFPEIFWNLQISSPCNIIATDLSHQFIIQSLAELVNSPVLTVTFFGDGAFKIEHESEEEILELIMNTLRKAFGKDIPYPTGGTFSKWCMDPFSRGSHSFVPKTSSQDLRKHISMPIAKGRICFAGEHTHSVHPSTINGAYESGIREASRILDTIAHIKPGQLIVPFTTSYYGGP